MRHFSQDELDQLCRPPEQRLVDAARSGSAHDVTACFERMISFVRGLADLYGDWSVTLLVWVRERHGLRAAGATAFYHELWPAEVGQLLDSDQLALTRSVLRGESFEEVDHELTAAAERVIRTGDPTALFAVWRRVHSACDRATTWRRDALTAQLTLVHDRYGPQGLEECLRHTAEIIFVPRMSADLAQPASERLAGWAERMSAGLNSRLTIREYDDRWVLGLDPCGSCGRQVLDGRFEPPWNLGVVQDGSPAGFLRSDITVYQAHLAVMHTLMPIEHVGAPWPAISCRGLTGGVCDLVLFKDPADTDEQFFDQVGLNKRSGEVA